MTHIASAAAAAEATFGRDGALFESLLGFVAQLSLVLWGLVIFTAIIRFVGIRIYRRGTNTALVEPAVPGAEPAPAVQAAMAVIDLVQPAARQLADVRLGVLGPDEEGKETEPGQAAPDGAFVADPKVPDATMPAAATTGGLEEFLHPASVPDTGAATAALTHPTARARRAEHRSAGRAHASAGHVHVFAGNSTEG